MSMPGNPRQPTAEECNERARVDNGRAFWWPQMGGYVARALAVPTDCCIDVYVWHDGEFPFDGQCHGCRMERSPVRIHMDDGDEWIALGDFLNSIPDLVRFSDAATD